MNQKTNLMESIMNLEGLHASATTIRALSMDAIEKAKSGHPGLPLGCAEIGSYLFGEVLKHNPKNLHWMDRDRFVLSAGHGSMLLYSLFFLSGYGLTVDDIKNFRQLKSKTPGHPEYGWTEGVETSTGPLGQGLANGVGMALAGKINGQKFNTDDHKIFNSRVFVIAGDGDMMEGLSYESCSLAGHLKLDNLVVIYDSNNITIEGCTDITFTEDVAKRFDAFGWHVVKIDGHDFNDIKRGFDEAEKERLNQNKPVLIIANTTIGKCAPNKQGTNTCHGAPLGEEECKLFREAKNIGNEFYVDPKALQYFEEKKAGWAEENKKWEDSFNSWSKKHPKLKELLDKNFSLKIDDECFKNYPEFKAGEKIATRVTANTVLNSIVKDLDFVISGSADLGSSAKTIIKDKAHITNKDFTKHNIQYGIREHAMGAIANGMYLFGGILPIVGTFLSFVEYMKPAIRMSAMMRIPITFLFSHDSIFVGEDGPTHQPIEHITGLRIIPNLNVMRPADPHEAIAAWEIALKSEHTPSIIITTRQNIPTLDFSNLEDFRNAKNGAYILKKEKGNAPDIILIASGSEVAPALEAAEMLEKDGASVRVVSMFSMFLFDHQNDEYKEKVLPASVQKRVAVEAGIDTPWYKYVGLNGDIISIQRLGISGKAEELCKKFGFTSENIYSRAKKLL